MIAEDGIKVNLRFYQAIDELILLRILRGRQTFYTR